MDPSKVNQIFQEALSRVKGLEDNKTLRKEDLQTILDLEQKAEDQSLMGLGKVVNSGVREIIQQDYIYVALTNMEFDWGEYSTLVLKKGPEIVGKEVRKKEVIEELSKKDNVWFLHKNFVVFKDRIDFPKDIMKKICHFEIPCLPAEFCVFDADQVKCRSIHFATPCVPGDVFLKERYFDGQDKRGLGTILVGFGIGDEMNCP